MAKKKKLIHQHDNGEFIVTECDPKELTDDSVKEYNLTEEEKFTLRSGRGIKIAGDNGETEALVWYRKEKEPIHD